MHGRNEFRILGRVGKIHNFEKVIKVSIASDSPRRDDRGDWQSNTAWNTVTVFGEQTITWIKNHLMPGDLVDTTGSIGQSSYGEGEEKTYTTDLVVRDFHRLAKRDQLSSTGDNT